MLASWSQRDRPASMLYFKHGAKHIYGTLISNHGYYEFQGLPLWVYTEGDGPPPGNYLAYRTRPKESIEFVDVMPSEVLVIPLPIIKLSEKLSVVDI